MTLDVGAVVEIDDNLPDAEMRLAPSQPPVLNAIREVRRRLQERAEKVSRRSREQHVRLKFGISLRLGVEYFRHHVRQNGRLDFTGASTTTMKPLPCWRSSGHMRHLLVEESSWAFFYPSPRSILEQPQHDSQRAFHAAIFSIKGKQRKAASPFR